MKKNLVLIFTGLMLAVAPALADTFVWKDPKSDFTMSFPDSWRMMTEDSPNTKLRVIGPIAEDLATCKIQVRKDGRLQIYTKPLLDEAVNQTLNRNFWEHETGQFESAIINHYYSPAGLGDKGDATAIHVSYLQDDGAGNKIPMHGIMIASIYADDIYVASCSSRHEKYAQYAPVFGSIVDSIMLEPKYHPYATGYYRNFFLDKKLVIANDRPGTSDSSLTPHRESGYSGYNN